MPDSFLDMVLDLTDGVDWRRNYFVKVLDTIADDVHEASSELTSIQDWKGYRPFSKQKSQETQEMACVLY